MTAPDPTFSANTSAAIRRDKDYLELAFQPAVQGGAVTFARVPLLSELGGFQPQTNVARKPLFVDADGKTRTLVAIMNEGGNIQFAVAANSSDPTFKAVLKASKEGKSVLYKAHYASSGVTIQGEAAVQDRGMQGGATDIPEWGFTLEAMAAEYLDAAGAVIA
ncbi:hypothetical protein [Deinococcus radiophilus]|uniref:Uncharacterized protein n=1 Tax=Deinococcus radiophilus TaxID=32062 RepID=A0A3S0JUB0_9DEIO|nr:hypothetical protein [Deinococcus radiophilus]RTR29066.1 hypothetical protein EJ104_04270 [Deinococcus radiophilus]UFA49653.1 hypothetical protein LMT64_07035 [Deinococcus radiophilus]